MRLRSRNHARGKPKANRDVLERLGSPAVQICKAINSFCKILVKEPSHFLSSSPISIIQVDYRFAKILQSFLMDAGLDSITAAQK